MTNKPMLSVELLPCPFCGGQPVKKRTSGDERDGYSDHVTYQCAGCGCTRGARGDSSKGGYADNSKVEDRALSAWNSRHRPAAQAHAEPVSLQHMAVAEDGKLRWMTGRKMQGCELYAMPDGSAIRSKLYAEQPAPLKIGSGVTVKNIGFGSEKERKPYLVFGSDGCLTEVNLVDVSLVSKRKAHTIPDLEAIGVRVEQPAPAAADNSALIGILISEISVDDKGFYHLSGIHPGNFNRAIEASGATLAENIPAYKSPVAVVIDIESAAKKLAECMDYPWEHMPEQGRQSMRESAKAVVDAARLNGVKP